MKGKSNASRKARASEGARIHGQVLCVSVIVSKKERERERVMQVREG